MAQAILDHSRKDTSTDIKLMLMFIIVEKNVKQ